MSLSPQGLPARPPELIMTRYRLFAGRPSGKGVLSGAAGSALSLRCAKLQVPASGSQAAGVSVWSSRAPRPRGTRDGRRPRHEFRPVVGEESKSTFRATRRDGVAALQAAQWCHRFPLRGGRRSRHSARCSRRRAPKGVTSRRTVSSMPRENDTRGRRCCEARTHVVVACTEPEAGSVLEVVNDRLQDGASGVGGHAEKRPRWNPTAGVAEMVRGSVDDVGAGDR